MIYKNPNNEKVEFENRTPIKIIPLADDFKEELYNLYKVYRPKVDHDD